MMVDVETMISKIGILETLALQALTGNGAKHANPGCD